MFLWRKTRPQTTTYSLVSPRTDTLRRTVVATGKVEPRDEVLIKPQISEASYPNCTKGRRDSSSARAR